MIDHIVTSKPDKVADSGVVPYGISNHGLIYIIRHAKLLKIKQLLDGLNGIPSDLITDTSDNASGLWLTWKAFFLNVLNKHTPIKTIRVRGNNLPYVTAEVKSLMRQWDCSRGKANKSGSKYLRQVYQQLSKSDYYTKKIEESKNNLKNTWRVLKKCNQ